MLKRKDGTSLNESKKAVRDLMALYPDETDYENSKKNDDDYSYEED